MPSSFEGHSRRSATAVQNTSIARAIQRLNSWWSDSKKYDDDVLTLIRFHKELTAEQKNTLKLHKDKLLNKHLQMVTALQKKSQSMRTLDIVKLDKIMSALQHLQDEDDSLNSHCTALKLAELQEGIAKLVMLSPGIVFMSRSTLNFTLQVTSHDDALETFSIEDGIAVQGDEKAQCEKEGQVIPALQEDQVLRATSSFKQTPQPGTPPTRRGKPGTYAGVIETKPDGRVVNQTDAETMKSLSGENQEILALQQAQLWLESIAPSASQPAVRITGTSNDAAYAAKLHAALLALSKEMQQSLEIKNYVTSGPQTGWLGTYDDAFIKQHLPNVNAQKIKGVTEEILLLRKLKDQYQVAMPKQSVELQQQAIKEQLTRFSQFRMNQEGDIEPQLEDESRRFSM